MPSYTAQEQAANDQASEGLITIAVAGSKMWIFHRFVWTMHFLVYRRQQTGWCAMIAIDKSATLAALLDRSLDPPV